jgi:hypothetical protein
MIINVVNYILILSHFDKINLFDKYKALSKNEINYNLL